MFKCLRCVLWCVYDVHGVCVCGVCGMCVLCVVCDMCGMGCGVCVGCVCICECGVLYGVYGVYGVYGCVCVCVVFSCRGHHQLPAGIRSRAAQPRSVTVLSCSAENLVSLSQVSGGESPAAGRAGAEAAGGRQEGRRA